jgi:hypothetical protein
VEEIAVALVDSLRARLRAVAAAVSSAEKRPRVLSLEGLRPLAVGGHWLPEMKSLAGGSDELQEPGAPAVGLRWEQVLAYAPEVLILSPCVSPSPHQTLAELDRLASNPGFWAIPAVKNRRVYVVHHVLFSRAGPRRAAREDSASVARAGRRRARGRHGVEDDHGAGQAVPAAAAEAVFHAVGRRGGDGGGVLEDHGRADADVSDALVRFVSFRGMEE